MRFQNAYMLGLLRRTIKIPEGSRIVSIPSTAREARINQKTGTREAPQRWKVLHETSKKETKDSKFVKEMKEKYGSNIKDWPTYPNGVVINPPEIQEIDSETLTQTTCPLEDLYANPSAEKKEIPAKKFSSFQVEGKSKS